MKNVIICGLGAVGLTYATKFVNKCNLRILVDECRFEKYNENPPVFNGKEQKFDYILPDSEKNFDADLILITTKADGLNSAIEYMKNYITKDTYIISLINGISSEGIIKKSYPQAKVVKSYFIGHSAVREGNFVSQDGVGEIVFEHTDYLEEFFDELNIKYSIPNDIDYSMWLKFTLNLFSNQTSAILNLTFGDMKKSKNFKNFAKNIISEVKLIAEKEGVRNTDKLETDAFEFLTRMIDSGKTSMLQDILAGRKTEVEIFSGEIIKLGKKYNIYTPYNQVLYELLKIKEEITEESR